MDASKKVEPPRETLVIDQASQARKHLRLTLVILRARPDLRVYVPEGELIEKQIDMWLKAMLKEFANPGVRDAAEDGSRP